MTTPPCYSCIIVDDEHTARHGLRSYVNRVQHLTCLAELTDVTALDVYLRNHNAPDIIFMDIEMPGQSGLDFIASVELRTAFIIVTAYERYALRGYELNVCDYLLKPVSFTRFCQSLDKAIRFVDYRKGISGKNHIVIRADRITHRIDLNDIIYLEACENYVRITTTDDRITTRSTLKDLLSQLPENEFHRVHKSYAVNISRIRSVGSSVVMEQSIAVPLSRSSTNSLLSALDALKK